MGSGKIVGVLVIMTSLCVSIILAFLGLSLMTGLWESNPKPVEGTEVVIVLPSQTPLPPTATPLPTQTPIPLPTSTPIPLPTNTPIPLPTNTPLPLPTNTPMPLPSNTPVPPTNTSPSTSANLTDWENRIYVAIDLTGKVDLQSVRIADGRANGGERVLIVAFYAPASEQLNGVAIVWRESYFMMRDFEMDIDSITVVYGVSENSGSTFVSLNVSDLFAYYANEIDVNELIDRAH